MLNVSVLFKFHNIYFFDSNSMKRKPSIKTFQKLCAKLYAEEKRLVNALTAIL